MRLGSQECRLLPTSLTRRLYGQDTISERHRHRYEFNNNYRKTLEEKGLIVAGTSIDGNLVEIVELPAHPWFVAVQFHPEFTSSPIDGHPLFQGYIQAVREHRVASGQRQAVVR
jgi:CTP synthase